MPRNFGISSSLYWLGWILVGLGSASILLGIFTTIFTWSWIKYLGCSIWAGIFVLITGILGVRSGKAPADNICWAIAFMVMSILSILATLVQWVFSSLGIYINDRLANDFSYEYYYWEMSNKEGCMALHSLTMIVGLAEMVVAFIASICCCCFLCNRSSQQVPHVVTYTTPGPAMVTVLPNGQILQHQYPHPTTTVFPATTTSGMPANQPGAQGYVVVPPQPGYTTQPPGQTWQPEQPQYTEKPAPPYTTQPDTQPAAPPLYEEIAEPSKETPPTTFH